jgi:hypothetical protein
VQVIYCGTIVTEEGKEKKVNIDFEPFKPINTSLYLCDNKFHTEALTALLADDNRCVIIIAVPYNQCCGPDPGSEFFHPGPLKSFLTQTVKFLGK